MKPKLERLEIPGEHDARERAWAVVSTAFAQREPTTRPSNWPRVAAVAVALTALAAAVLSPPGRAVLDELREVVGVERAQPALFSLPAPGRLLVASDAGLWVVQQDGSKRLLGPYREASWSPFGRFVVAARANELAALEPDGDVRWTLARPGVRSPRWAGTDTDTRIAYVDRTGSASSPATAPATDSSFPGARGPLAWRPGSSLDLAYVDPGGRVAMLDTTRGRTVWRGRRDGRVVELEWSSDGRRLVATAVGARDDVAVYTTRGALYTGFRVNRGLATSAAIRPRQHSQAIALYANGQSRLHLPGVQGITLSGPGALEDLAWSPDSNWLIASWPGADQWVFVRADGKRIQAVSNVADQFRSRSFPRVQGWCCTH